MTKIFKDQTEQKISDADLEKTYAALNQSTEFWVIVARGAFALRFGPYTGAEAGEILTRGCEERIVMNVVGNCGREFDWEIAKDMGLRLVLDGDLPTLKQRVMTVIRRLFTSGIEPG
jgi:hypothetical protein